MIEEEETLSETARKYYVLRYALIGIVLLSSLALVTTASFIDNARPQANPPEFVESAVQESDTMRVPAGLVTPSLPLGLVTGGLLLVVGLVYATYTRMVLPGFMKGYVAEQAPFWDIRRKARDYTIQMNGNTVFVRFFSKRRSRWGALRIELPLSLRLNKEQIKQICEQNGVTFSDEENLISTVAAPEELNWKLLQFSRIVRQIKTLGG